MNLPLDRRADSESAGPRIDRCLVIGALAHEVVARALRAGPIPDEPFARALRLRTLTRDTMAARPPLARARSARFEVATAAGVYLEVFQPGGSWRFIDSEVALGGGRADLVFEHESGVVLVDEIKLGIGRGGQVMVSKQVARYVVGGRDRWGDRFAGVRLVALSEPRRSRFYKPDAAYSVPLAETAFEDLRAGR